MLTKDITQKKLAAVAAARAVASNPAYDGSGELEIAYQRAVSDARRFAQLESENREIDTLNAETDRARSGLASVIYPERGGIRTAPTIGEAEVRAWLDPENPKRSLYLPLGAQSRSNEEWWKDVGSTVKAGYTVPTSLLDRVIYHINGESSIWAPSYHLNTSTGEDITVPVLATDATAHLTAEKTAATITNPVFGSETLKSYRLDGFFVLSMELMRDSGVDVTRLVGDAAGRAIGTLLGQYLATGTGSGEPEGITIGSTSAATCASKTVFTLNELKTLYYSVPAGARRNGCFIMGTDSIALLATLIDDNGNYIWQPALIAGQPDTLFGRPCLEDCHMPSLASGNRPIVFGDLSNYFYIRTVDRATSGGILLEFDSSPLFTSFEVTARWAIWTDSRVMGGGGEIKYLALA